MARQYPFSLAVPLEDDVADDEGANGKAGRGGVRSSSGSMKCIFGRRWRFCGAFVVMV